MNARWNPRWFVVLTAFVSLQLLAGAAQAQQPPKSVTVGTNPAGTVFYAVGGGLASVISGAAPFQAVIQPYTGSTPSYLCSTTARSILVSSTPLK